MIAKPPRLTEEQFLRGATTATTATKATKAITNGSGSDFKCTLRLPADLASWLRDEAHHRRLSLNAFLIEIFKEKRGA